MIVIIVGIVFAFISFGASISYDCDTRSGVFESEKYWMGSLNRDLLPCEFKDIDMPEDYNQFEVPQNPNHEITVSIRRLEFLEDGEKCNVTIDAHFEWRDRRLKFFENVTSKIGKRLRVPLSAIYHIWNPFPWIYYDAEDGLQETCRLDSPEECLSKLFLYYYKDNKSGIDFVQYFGYSDRKSVIIDSRSTAGYTYYPHDKHEYLLFVGQGIEGKWVSPRKYFKEIKFSSASFKIHVTSRSHEPQENVLVETPYPDRINQTVYVIVFTRKLQSHFIRTYLPSGLFVFLSWLSMLVPVELATERVALCTATLLTITLFFNTASQLGPETSYLRASDIWLLGCILFVFVILFENIAVMKITGRLAKKLPKPPVRTNSKIEKAFERVIMQLQLHQLGMGSAGESSGQGLSGQEMNSLEPDTDESGENGKGMTGGDFEGDKHPREKKFGAAKWLDRITVFVVIAGILTCNVIYWTWLLVTKQTECERDSQCSSGMFN